MFELLGAAAAGSAQQVPVLPAARSLLNCRACALPCLLLPEGNGLAADLTLGAENGAAAVDFVRRQVLAVPPLRPLCLAIKAFLRFVCLRFNHC